MRRSIITFEETHPHIIPHTPEIFKCELESARRLKKAPRKQVEQHKQARSTPLQEGKPKVKTHANNKTPKAHSPVLAATSTAAATLVIVIITSLVFAKPSLCSTVWISDIYDKSRSIVHRSFPQCQRCERLRGRGKF